MTSFERIRQHRRGQCLQMGRLSRCRNRRVDEAAPGASPSAFPGMKRSALPAHIVQIIRGVAASANSPAHATDQDDATLQTAMDKQAPDVSTVLWGHKYFSLILPDKLDDYHVPNYQRFHLVRLLQPTFHLPRPPLHHGRALRCLGRRATDYQPSDYDSHEMTGQPYNYWRVSANNHGGKEKDYQLWPLFAEKEVIAAQGWANVGDRPVSVQPGIKRRVEQAHGPDLRRGCGGALGAGAI